MPPGPPWDIRQGRFVEIFRRNGEPICMNDACIAAALTHANA